LISGPKSYRELRETGPRTQLRLLEGLPIFSDHFYVYGHLPKEEVVSVGNRLHCSSGENGATKRIVSRISNLVRETLGSTYKNTKLLYPIPANTPGGRIIDTISTIETETNSKAKKQLQTLFPEIALFYYFVAKVHIAEVEMEKLQQALPTLESLLEDRGDAIFQIDFTQDFLGRPRPKSACRAFAQLDRFCFPGLWVPRSERHYSGQHSERWWARLHLDTDNRQRVYDKDKAIQQNSLAVRSGRSPDPRLRLFYGETSLHTWKCEKRLYSNRGVSVCLSRGRLSEETAKELV